MDAYNNGEVMLCSQQFYDNFIINFRWLIVIDG